MRVITGKARGRHLETLSGTDLRPTTDMVKEAVFSILQFQLEGRVFLDMFAGSGQMGIEAISRGAKEAHFFEARKEAVSVIRNNLKTVGFEKEAQLRQGDSLSLVKMSSVKYDVAFVDPPYNKGIAAQALCVLCEYMNPGGVIVCETAIEEEMPQSVGEFELDRTYRYGKIKITTYRRAENL